MQFTGGVSYLSISGGSGSGTPVIMQATDLTPNNAPISIDAYGVGEITLGTIASTNQYILRTGSSKNTTINVDNSTSTPQILTIPDVTGTMTVRGNTTTGSGDIVKNTSPTFVTPALGVPSSGTLTNCDGLPLTTGVTGNLGVSHFNSGTNASVNKFWRGDGTWQTLGGLLYTTTTTLTTSDLLNLNTTPVLMIPGVAGFVIVPLYAFGVFTFGTASFNVDRSCYLSYGSNVTKIADLNFLITTSSSVNRGTFLTLGRINTFSNVSVTNSSGQPIYINSITTGVTGGGTCTYTLSVTYYLIEL